jgi:hypothetical protein
VYFVGAREEDASRSDIYAASETAAPVRVTDADAYKTSPVVDPAGGYLIYTVAAANPFRRPDVPAGGAQGGPGGGAQGQPGGPGSQAGAAPRFGIVHLATKRTNVVTGASPAISADGSTIAYLVPAREAGRENSLQVMPAFGTPVAVKTTTDRLASPALSPDGKRAAFQMMTREDWEVYVVNSDGTGETRVTHEIQHDVTPQFVTGDLLLATMGEPRHRRSYLYDLTTLKRSRLFHNNTVRTIAPEYAWVIGPDPAKMLIGAERDGDTVSPARGIYLMHLDRRVRGDEVLARLKTSLAAEVDLRDRGQKMFQPIAADVRKALLETARLLAGRPLPATVVFASFTGEESGLLGSREWVRQAVEKKLKVVGALNNDTVGWTNDHRLDNTIRYSNPGIRDVQHAAAMQFARMITYDALYYKGTDANA